MRRPSLIPVFNSFDHPVVEPPPDPAAPVAAAAQTAVDAALASAAALLPEKPVDPTVPLDLSASLREALTSLRETLKGLNHPDFVWTLGADRSQFERLVRLLACTDDNSGNNLLSLTLCVSGLVAHPQAMEAFLDDDLGAGSTGYQLLLQVLCRPQRMFVVRRVCQLIHYCSAFFAIREFKNVVDLQAEPELVLMAVATLNLNLKRVAGVNLAFPHTVVRWLNHFDVFPAVTKTIFRPEVTPRGDVAHLFFLLLRADNGLKHVTKYAETINSAMDEFARASSDVRVPSIKLPTVQQCFNDSHRYASSPFLASILILHVHAAIATLTLMHASKDDKTSIETAVMTLGGICSGDVPLDSAVATCVSSFSGYSVIADLYDENSDALPSLSLIWAAVRVLRAPGIGLVIRQRDQEDVSRLHEKIKHFLSLEPTNDITNEAQYVARDLNHLLSKPLNDRKMVRTADGRMAPASRLRAQKALEDFDPVTEDVIDLFDDFCDDEPLV